MTRATRSIDGLRGDALVDRCKVLLVTPRLVLALPPLDLAPRYLRYCEENDEHLAPWEPPREEGYFTAPYWRDDGAAITRVSISRTGLS